MSDTGRGASEGIMTGDIAATMPDASRDRQTLRMTRLPML